MRGTSTPDCTAGGIASRQLEASVPVVASLAPVRASLEGLGDRLLEVARRIERPILEVGAFLESIQDLESAKPVAGGRSRLAMALQSYDVFHQKIQVAEHLIDLLTMAMQEGASTGQALPGPAMLTNAESVCYHLDCARALIDNAASEIPPAVSQVLCDAGASPQKFQSWGIHRSLAEIGRLTLSLGEVTAQADEVRKALAEALGVDPDERFGVAPPEADYEDGSITLFESGGGTQSRAHTG